MPKEIDEIDSMVRDFTSIVPRSKSEVRRRIQEFAAKEVEAFREKAIKGIDDYTDKYNEPPSYEDIINILRSLK